MVPRTPTEAPPGRLARTNVERHTAVIGRKNNVPDAITMPYSQYAACCDSLRRAEFAVEASHALCKKAARAFADEQACLQKCADIFKSFDPAASSTRIARLERV